jgi:hypothetical protein
MECIVKFGCDGLVKNSPGLPNGFKPKSQFEYIFGLAMDNVGIFYGQLEHFTAILVYFIAIWYILWSFGIFSPFLVHCNNKNLATCKNTFRITPRFLRMYD